MRIGIDARMLGTGYGIGRYIEQLITHLEQIDSDDEHVFFIQSRGKDQIEKLDIQNSKFVITDIPWYGWQEQFKMSAVIKKENVDLMHFPHWNVPLLYRKPYVVTIHDLTMYHFARPAATTLGPIVYWIKDRLHRVIVRNAVRRAKAILVPSETVKHDLVSTLGVQADKIVTTYLAPFPMHDGAPVDLAQTYGITKPYVLYIGSAYPHKNLSQLVQAWKRFRAEHSEYQLVLAGPSSPFYDRVKSEAAGDSSILFPGLIPEDHLPALYRGASLYAFPSLAEGFGIPPLEAMQYGVPVVSSNASCMPEVLGEAALYMDAQNTSHIAAVIDQGLHDKDVRLQLKHNARELLQRYSWQQCAIQTHAVYKRA